MHPLTYDVPVGIEAQNRSSQRRPVKVAVSIDIQTPGNVLVDRRPQQASLVKLNSVGLQSIPFRSDLGIVHYYLHQHAIHTQREVHGAVSEQQPRKGRIAV